MRVAVFRCGTKEWARKVADRSPSAGTTGPLPPLYRRWIGEVLGSDIPDESRATCHDCAMCPPPGKPPVPNQRYFDRQVKCCSYSPVLPNFLVGFILADTSPSGRMAKSVVLQRLESGVGVTPVGIESAPRQSALYQASPEAFGLSRNALCPFLARDSGRCTIHAYRNAVCATFFCKHERGRIGQEFWRGALQPLLGAIELQLSRINAEALLDDDETLAATLASDAWRGQPEPLTAAILDDRADEARNRRLWGRWAGAEREFFIQCAERVRDLAFSEVAALCGPEVRAYARLSRARFQTLMSETLPEKLVPAPLKIIRTGDQDVRVTTYSAYDPIDVPALVAALLHVFEGRSVEEARAEFKRATGGALDPSLLRKLVDFDVLMEPSA